MPATALTIDARWHELQQQRDPGWELGAITERSEAIAFLRRFENRLCIYCRYVEKLYGNYSFVVPQDERGGITILADDSARHETFHDIPAAAVEPTGVHILPGEAVGETGLYLKVPGEFRLVASRELPFQDGLRLLIERYRARGEHFLPVLVKGDLREFEARMPSLHLHRINTRKLAHGAQPSIDAIRGTIAEHLLGLFQRG
ncbi:hypothetical protein ACUTAF_16235 [Pseudomonas sp. SP16.1]|uniref:hypothetical protein n=1 Tax=Pseudomonas sp. SP16.1 TaxID=3458854 RepID=UPI004045AD63